MKLQDLGFFIVLAALIYIRKPRLSAMVGIVSLIASMPLFHIWKFFTAQRLTYYAAAFFLLSTLLHLFKLKKQI